METVWISLKGAFELFAVGLVVGAGLPIIFALGVRLWSGNEATADGVAAAPAATGAKVLAWVCFAAVAFAVLVGIEIIVGAGMGKVVSFEHIFPTLVPKP
ncbi:MAG TPA: hypothetical protein PKK40_01575 [Marmoricola sp.]|nr:hypothetical protein [Marmoricola sp.]